MTQEVRIYNEEKTLFNRWIFFYKWVIHPLFSLSWTQDRWKKILNLSEWCASKVLVKILQARLQQCMNQEIPDVQAGFGKGRRTRDQIANICWIQKKQENSRKKHLLLLFWLCQSVWLYGSQKTGKFYNGWEHSTAIPVSWETCMQDKK